jgi:hypothetical protein
MRNKDQRRSRLQELRAANLYGGRTTPGSGNGWVKKGDVRTVTELFELKTTTKASYPLKASELKEHWDHALIDGRTPVFEIEYANAGVTCVILDKDDYLALRNASGLNPVDESEDAW